jgi:DNA-binding transcriptional LysR family regulator
VFGDPLLVKQGRNVAITPCGGALREQIRPLLRETDALLVPDSFDPAKLRQSFVLRAGEAVLASGGSQILAQTAAKAPNVHIRFENEATDDYDALRSGAASLAIGSYSNLPPDISSEHLVDEHLVGVVRGGHECLKRNMTVRRFAALDQLVVSRRGIAHGPVDRLLAEHDLIRHVAAVVPSFGVALAMAAQSDLFAILPSRFASVFTQAAGLPQFAIPLELPTVAVGQIWHHRLANDPAHQWLRSCFLRASASF